MTDDVDASTGVDASTAGRIGGSGLTHVRADGAVHMVDVSSKTETTRTAVAQAIVRTTPEVVAMIADGALPKGEALATARIAGILAAKQTSALIPLCHPLPIDAVSIEIGTDADAVRIEASVRTRGVTGVEMEALTAASVAALTVYDMIKSVDRAAVIGDIRVLSKAGGKTDFLARAAGSGASGTPAREEP